MKYLVTVFVIFVSNGYAQTKIMASAFADKIPAFSQTSKDAYSQFYKKEKTAPLYILLYEIDEAINMLYKRSDRKSRLLSMMAKRFEDDSETTDFTRIKVAREPELAELVKNSGLEWGRAVDDFMRAVHIAEAENGKKLQGIALADKNLAAYNERFPGLLSVYRKHLGNIVSVVNKKQLSANNSSGTFYIQVLESEGLLLERLKNILRTMYSIQVLSSNMYHYNTQ